MKTMLAPWNWGTRRLPSLLGDDYPLMRSLQQEINRTFDEIFRRADILRPEALEEEISRFTPKVDVKETEKEIVVSAEIPGMDEKEIEVLLTDDGIVLRGEKKEEKEEKDKGYYRMERAYGAFHRAIPLPSEVEQDKAEAVFKNGVVTVTLPKTKKAQAQKKITVKAG